MNRTHIRQAYELKETLTLIAGILTTCVVILTSVKKLSK